MPCLTKHNLTAPLQSYQSNLPSGSKDLVAYAKTRNTNIRTQMRGLKSSLNRAILTTSRFPNYTRPCRTMTQMTNALENGHLPNTCQYTARTNRGDYLIQVAWPLGWGEDRVQPKDDAPISTL